MPHTVTERAIVPSSSVASTTGSRMLISYQPPVRHTVISAETCLTIGNL